MRISILDSYFIPFACYKLVYDPTLSPDDFIIENLYSASAETFQSTFTTLTQDRVIYLDSNKRTTLFGEFYGMAIFADKAEYDDYVYRRKSQERFNDETLYVASRTGDPRLRQEIERLNQLNGNLTQTVADQTESIDQKDKAIKILRADLRAREEALSRITSHHDAKFSSDAVLGTLENERLKIGVDHVRATNDRIEQEHRERVAPAQHKASVLKTSSEILKSGWAIVTASLAGIVSIIALCKKYNIKLSMSA